MTSIVPACNTLGTAVNMTQEDIDPFNIDDVICSVSEDFVEMLSGGENTTLPGSELEYRLPSNARLRKGTGSESRVNSLVVKKGYEFADSLTASTNTSASYLGVTASASLQYEYNSSFKSNSEYAMCSFDQYVYDVYLDPSNVYAEGSVNTRMLAAVETLPPWPTKPDSASYTRYRQFFAKFGSHIVTSCTMGTRYQLQVEAEETSSEKRQNLKTNVNFEFKGIVNSGAGYEKGKDWSSYLQTRISRCRVRGGEPGANGDLARNPGDAEKFTAWQKSRTLGEHNAVTNIKLESICQFLHESPVASHRTRSQDLITALDYFSTFRKLAGGWQVLVADPVNKGGFVNIEMTALPGLRIKAL